MPEQNPDPALVARLQQAMETAEAPVASTPEPEEKPAPKVTPEAEAEARIPELVKALTPDQEILTLIELAAKGGDGQCVLEPNQPCSNSQRCKRRGF